mgnify:CR=1 FL=1
MRHKIAFDNLTPLYPDKQLKMEVEKNKIEKKPDQTARLIDLVSPIGKGQRSLIISPPKAGKTIILQNIAHSLAANHHECYLMVLLIDERTEEVTDMQRSVKGAVISSTFDEPASLTVAVADMVIEKSKSLKIEEENWSVSFQSRLGRDEWVKPYTDLYLKELAEKGMKRVVVFCPSFVADCLETMEEIGISAAEHFKEYGGEELKLVPSLNNHPEWVRALTSIIRQQLVG